jgi:molybdopterin molybdotransferase
VSVGDVDFVKTVLDDICDGRARWMQVAMRPGKPFAFGVADPAPHRSSVFRAIPSRRA